MDTGTGIWLDRKQAYIVKLENKTHTITKIDSDADFRIREDGEGKNYTRFGDQFYTHEKTQEYRLEHQLNDYYQEIAKNLNNTTEIFIFGPAEAKKELHKFLEDRPSFSAKIITRSSDKLTENQIVAAVKKHFSY